MIPYLYLTAATVLVSTTSIGGSLYNRKNADKKDPTPFYNFICILSIVLGWAILWGLDFSFDAAVLPYSAVFALGFAVSMLGIIQAFRCGPVALSTLIQQLSLIGTTVWGFFFWGAEVTLTVVIGLVLVVVALFLCLYVKPGSNERPFSLRWLAFISLAFVGNAACAITQRTQQLRFDGQHGNMLMFFATLFSSVLLTVIYFRSDRRDSKELLRGSVFFPVFAGVGNVFLNLFVLLLATTPISSSLIYPTIGVGGIALVTLFSVVILKEKLRLSQVIGIVCGAAATALLSM